MKKIFASLSLGLAMPIAPAAAQDASSWMSVEEFQEARAESPDNELLSDYIKAVVDGILWTSIYVEDDKAKRLYCPPRRMEITTDQYEKIVDSYVTRYPNPGKKLPMVYALILALQHTFPCGEEG